MVTNPRLCTYVLHILQGHLMGFHFRIFLVNLDSEYFFMSDGTSAQICGPRCAKVSVPQEVVLTLKVLNTRSLGYMVLEFKGKIKSIILGARP